MDTLKNMGNYVSNKAQGASSEASKETNKSTLIHPSIPNLPLEYLEPSSLLTNAPPPPAIAKDSQAPLGTRMRAAGDALSDKMDQHGHEADAKVDKERTKH
ncbi:MAG: hypothetical protein Q9173_007026 [Seirophora scorigena]